MNIERGIAFVLFVTFGRNFKNSLCEMSRQREFVCLNEQYVAYQSMERTKAICYARLRTVVDAFHIEWPVMMLFIRAILRI